MRDTDKYKRLYVFLDETGDPGLSEDSGASASYQLNIVSADALGIMGLLKHISGFRYFNDTGRELEKHHKSADKLCDIFRHCNRQHQVHFSSFCVIKSGYMTHYLARNNIDQSTYNPTYFRNYIVRKSLEILFSDVERFPYPEVELIIDRYLDSEKDETNLKHYLRNNWSLPDFLHINQVDSVYCEPIQTADYLGKLVKDNHIASNNRQNLDFVHCFNMETPTKITKEKCPATQRVPGINLSMDS